MYELHYWPTPNAHKVTMFLEELGLPFEIVQVNIGKGDQFKPEFLAISPNNRMPAIVDHAPADGGEPIAIFESGAILLYLAEKHAAFIPTEIRGRKAVLEWLFWQMAGLGPMLGQNHHFSVYAQEKIPYAIERYVSETARLYGVLDRQLATREFIIGDAYTIADMACYPWIVAWKRQQMQLTDYVNVHRWFETIRARPATVSAYAHAGFYTPPTQMTDEMRLNLFGQGATRPAQ
jgi:GST-like protein